MAASTRSDLFATKSFDRLTEESSSESGLRRAMGALDLTALGIGAIIGSGIFVILGEAIGDSGPAIILSFVLAGVTCAFSALSYSELAAAVPVSGSAYTYSYATLGELVAWIIGWDLLLEYGFSVATVAVGWGDYLKRLFDGLFSITIPSAIAEPPGAGGTVNVPAVVLVVLVTIVLVLGIRETARFNTIMVGIKLLVLALFIALAFTAFNSANLKPFAPHGFNGTVDAAAIIFFAYIGFDAVTTSSEEVKNPGKTLPRGIIGSLAIATLIYILVAIAGSAAYPYGKLAGDGSPLATIVDQGAGFSWAANIISFGALVAITSVVLTFLYGQTRISFAMCRDGLLPRGLAKLSARRTPIALTLIFGVVAAVMAAFIPLSELAELVNIGTLFAFFLVNLGVIILRRTNPGLERPFRVPLVPVVPLIGAALCIYLMTRLAGATWWRFGLWMAIGLVVYFTYSRRHSVVNHGTGPAEAGGA
jgi:basic amino acid/polyamine antiporter, APA family